MLKYGHCLPHLCGKCLVDLKLINSNDDKYNLQCASVYYKSFCGFVSWEYGSWPLVYSLPLWALDNICSSKVSSLERYWWDIGLVVNVVIEYVKSHLWLSHSHCIINLLICLLNKKKKKEGMLGDSLRCTPYYVCKWRSHYMANYNIHLVGQRQSTPRVRY